MATLELITARYNGTKDYTAGKVYADGNFVCYSLEDEVREIDGNSVSSWKIHGKTAIPRGRYEVVLSHSPRFKRILPELKNVDGFTAIRSHRGNKADHSEGCILVGMNDGNDKDAWLGSSAPAETLLIETIDKAIKQGKKVYWTFA
jgi:hypothetical protein